MNYREQTLAILQGKQPDCVPWLGDLDYWVTALIGHGHKPKDFKRSPQYLDWHLDLGVGYYLQGHFPFTTTIHNCEVKEWNEGHRRYRQIATPKGTLRECWQWMPNDFTEGPIEHLIKTVDDLPAYQFIHANTSYAPDYAFATERLAQLKQNGAGMLLCYCPKSPLMQLVALDCGIEALVEIMADDPDLFDETIAILKTSHDQAARIAVDSPAEILMMPENLSSEVVGPNLFERYMRPYQSEWAAEIKKAGKFSCIHLDGTLKGLLRQECTVGLTFIEALTPAPVGDLAVEEWADFCGNPDTILWGGIPGGFFTPMISDAEFDNHVKRVLAVMRQSPRFVLGIADQIPPIGIEARVRRVRELVNEFGRYQELI